MAADLFVPPSKALDANANPYAGAKWFFYATGTTTPQTVYTTAALNVAHSNPVVADGSGKFANIFFDTALVYRGVLKSADESVTLHDIEPVSSSLFPAFAASGGAALVGFLQAGAGAVARTAQAKMRDIVTPEDFGAVGDAVIAADGFTPATLGTNDQAAFDAAVTYLNSIGGGTIVLGRKTYRVNDGVKLSQNISLQGSSGVSKLFKPGTATRTIVPQGVANGGLVTLVYPLTTLPTSINAVLILDGSGGRWIGKVSDLVIVGSMSGTNFETDLQTELGIVSTGSVSDSCIQNVRVWACKQAGLFPDIFASRFTGNRANRCWRGWGINKGTSLTYQENYASDCRDYGHSLHDLFYGGAQRNACDNLNDPVLYATRTRISTAYVLDGLDGFDFSNNGQEQTYGRHWFVGVTNDARIEGNTSLGLGSDYVGAGIIAVWYIEDNGQKRTIIKNNPVITYMAGGLLQGAAVKANHYNVYCAGAVDQRDIEWAGNTVRQNRYGAAGGNGWSKTTDAAYGGSLNPPLEKVTYNILYNGVVPAVISGDGVTAARTATGKYNFTFDTAFANTNYVCSTALTRAVGAFGGEGMGIEITGRTTTNVAVECEYYDGVDFDFERVDLTVTGFVNRLA